RCSVRPHWRRAVALRLPKRAWQLICRLAASTMGFERRYNEAFHIEDENAFVCFMQSDIPSTANPALIARNSAACRRCTSRLKSGWARRASPRAPRTKPYGRLSRIRLVWGFSCQGGPQRDLLFLSSFLVSFLLFDRAAGFLPPRPQEIQSRRVQRRSRTA